MLIICEECRKQYSDTIPACPHCGYVRINVVKKAEPQIPSPQRDEHKVGLSASALNCPHCGAPLSAADVLSSGWAHCKQCDRDVALSGTVSEFSDDGIIEKIYTFKTSKDDFHQLCMEKLMSVAEEDIFAEITNIKSTQNYIWVRQFGSGLNSDFVPMDSFGDAMFCKMTGGNAFMSYEDFVKRFPFSGMKAFNNDDVGDAEIRTKQLSASECKHKYMTDPNTNNYRATDYYYCIPFFEETYEYKGKTYHFYGDGTNGNIWFSWDEIAESEILAKGPKYTDIQPLLYTVIAILMTVLIAFVVVLLIWLFSRGFWSGILALVIIGIIVAICYPIIVIVVGLLGVPVAAVMGAILLVDKAIQASINVKRRRKFVAEYKRIQERKQSDARNRLGLELPFEVPEFPIP